jgi:hypothetical protein
MSSNSKEAPLSDNVSKQLTYDDDGYEDTGRRVKVNKEEKNKKNAKKMLEHNDETAAGRSKMSKKVSKSSSSTISQDSGRVLTRTLGEYFNGGDPVSVSLS